MKTRKARRLFFGAALGVVAVAAVLAFAATRGVEPGDDEVRSAAANGEAEPAAPTPVTVAEAQRGPVAVHLATTSSVEAERTARVLSQTSGVLTEVRVREGDQVAAGQVLARVDARQRRLALEQAELRLARAEAELSRQARAFEADLVSEYDFDKAKFDRDLAASERETARLELDHTEIRAPFAGRVTEVLLVAGAHLDPAQHLLTLSDFDTLVVRLYLPERDVVGLAPGQSARVHPESEVGEALPGSIREISPVVDPTTGTVKVTVAVPSPRRAPPGAATVRPGSFARVVIETGRREDAILAPKRAVIQAGGGAHVFVVEDGRAVRRAVALGVELDAPGGALVELVNEDGDGIRPGAQLVVAGMGALTPGDLVEVLNRVTHSDRAGLESGAPATTD